MSTSTTKPRIGITLGDCAGIGPEIVELALKSGRVPDSTEYVVLGRQPNCKPGEPTSETARAAAAALEEGCDARPPRRARSHRDRAGSQGPDVRSRIQIPGANGIFRGALRRQRFRHVFDRRKTHGRARHCARSSVQSPAGAQAVRDSACRPVAC